MDAGADDGAVEDEMLNEGRSIDGQLHFLLKFAQDFRVVMDFHRLVTAF